MEERGLSIAHTTIMRWVHQYGPQLEGIQLRQVRYLNNIVEHRIIVLLRNACVLCWGSSHLKQQPLY
uniref:Transposase n=1 Tax=Bacillus cereus HuA4-10 TaxID=1053206 RepID=J8D5Z9_BACCE|nr:hypothetical protein IGC_02273 [Bacillus cereus HuA4-10]